MYGLLERDIEYIRAALLKFPEIHKAIIFGSRAIGNFKNGSDIDLAIVGEQINRRIVAELYDYLNEVYPIPYFFDLIHYESISNHNLKKHIDTEGRIIFDNGQYK